MDRLTDVMLECTVSRGLFKIYTTQEEHIQLTFLTDGKTSNSSFFVCEYVGSNYTEIVLLLLEK